jgi:glycosyltransferase involved in cell wall biosynthesis
VNGAAAIHTTSALETQQLQQWQFRPSAVTIPNGIEIARFADLPPRSSFRSRWNIPPDCFLALFVGRLNKEKHLSLLIDAFALIAQASPDSHLCIIGPDQDGSGKAAQKQVTGLRLSNRVHFTGPLSGRDLVQAYCDADLLALVSHRENFGMVALEAMAVGRPVLLTREVGLADEVAQGGAGLVVESTPDAIGTAWHTLLQDQDLRRALGERGWQLARDRFASDAVARAMLALFASVSGEAHAQPGLAPAELPRT